MCGFHFTRQQFLRAFITLTALTGIFSLTAQAQIGIITTYAGGGPNNLSAQQANIGSPSVTALDAAGDLYIASPTLYLVFRVDHVTGQLTIFAGNGGPYYFGDGVLATSTGVGTPYGLAFDAAGNLYIADATNNAIRRVDAVTGIITTFVGDGGDCANDTDGLGDGCPAKLAIIYSPNALAFDASGNLFIADSGSCRIRRVDAATGMITTVAGSGSEGYSGDGGPATSARLLFPYGVAVDGSGNVFIADSYNYRIRRVDAATGMITTVAGSGSEGGYSGDGGPATSASLNVPSGVAVDGAGDLFIADTYDNRIRRVDGSTGIITTVVGNLSHPSSVEVDGMGNLLIADTRNNFVRLWDTSTQALTTTAGNGTLFYSGDGGPATIASLSFPQGVAVDVAGNVLISDSSSNRIRKVNAITGIITTVAGTGLQGYTGDGGAATSADLSGPYGVALDGTGNLFISDSGNNVVRRVDAVTGIITTVAGDGIAGYSGDGGPATKANLLATGLTVDSAGNIFISDGYDSYVRKVDAATGVITTVAGDGIRAYNGDGIPATSASLNWPAGLATDAAGDLFIADSNNQAIRRVDASTGVISKGAGTPGISGFGGNGGPATSAKLDIPLAVAFDDAGNLFIADSNNNTIRRVDAVTGIITRVGGDGNPGYCGDGGAATDACLGFPYGLTIDGAGNLFISDSLNHRIRRVPLGGGMTTVTASPNPAIAGQSVTLTATVTGLSPSGTLTFTKDGVALATVPVANGQAVYTQVYPWANTKAIVAEYSGDTINQPSTSALLNLVVNPATSTTTLVSSENPAVVGDSVTFAATVTSWSGLMPPDGGLVTFYKNGIVVATATLAGGQASYTKVFDTANTKSMTATYAGDVTNNGSTSAVLYEVVNPGP